MKTIITYYTLLFLSLCCSTSAFAFNDTLTNNTTKEIFSQEMTAVNTELMEWDIVRGEWMAQNLVKMAYDEPLTERPFEDQYTLAEFVDFIPEDRKRKIQKIIETNIEETEQSSSRRTYDKWLLMERTFGKVSCETTSGRTYGDPHISTFDGKSYSFQTVGEFVLSKSTTSNFEVQARQKASSEEVSLNIATAMNVNGDRVAFYTNEYPDGNRYEPLRVNGAVAYIKSASFTLPNGGIIRRQNTKKYIVSWPTGEQVMVDLRNSGSFQFLNVNVEVPTCNAGEYRGLLGNANGNKRDDLTTQSGRDIAAMGNDDGFFGGGSTAERTREKEYLRFLANDFANVYRVTNQTSLFDYGIGQNTMTFTDFNFPRIHRSVSDLSRGQRERARRRCRDRGINPANMNACIFDVAFIDLDPEPHRRIPRATTGAVLRPVPSTGNSGGGRVPGENPNGNVDGEVGGGSNTGVPTSAEKPATSPVKKPNTTVGNEENGNKPVKGENVFEKPQTLQQKPASPVRTQSEIKTPTKSPVNKPVRKPVSKPVSKPVRKPSIFKPTPKPSKPTPRVSSPRQQRTTPTVRKPKPSRPKVSSPRTPSKPRVKTPSRPKPRTGGVRINRR